MPDPLKRLILIAIIIVGAVLLRFVLIFVIRRVVNRVVSGVKKRHNVDDTRELEASPLAAVRLVQRTRSLGSVFSNGATAIIVAVSILMIFAVAAPGATGAFALITAAVGAGLGFGAQNIVRDVLNGIFIVSEDQLGIGDVVDTGLATGVVEDVGIRITQIRDVNGTLWFVRNGEILRLGNMSYGWARAIIDLAVPYDADVDAIQARILEVANELAADPKWKHRIIEKPALWGIESISAEAVVVRLVVKTRSTAKDDVARELRWRLKKALDEMGVRLPALNSIVLTGFDGAAGLRSSKANRQKPPASLDDVAKKNATPTKGDG
nr:mechanosensitive ion channel family protein [Leifsonia sp. AK011]